MEYINIHVSTVDSVEFRSAEPEQRSTWLNLLRFCCGQENGGCIEKAAALTDRQWIGICGVTAADVKNTCDLWTFDGDDLIVAFYPEDAEKQTRAMRKGGKIGNARRWGKRMEKTAPKSGGESGGDRTPESARESITERNGTEDKETKHSAKEEGHFPEQVSDSVVLAFGKSYAGDPDTGAPGPMADGWVADFLVKLNGRREWPRDWQRYMAACWRREFRQWLHPQTASEKNGGGGKYEKTAPVSASVRSIQLDKELRELNAQVAADRANDIQPSPELAEKIAQLEREKQAMGNVRMSDGQK